jgi:FixJ family two-component response regulator
MNYRSLIFDDDEMIRGLLQSLFKMRGYDVVAFQHPHLFPLLNTGHCPCTGVQCCTDVIISDMKMPFQNGLDFIEELISRGCRCKNIALMSGSFETEHLSRAKSLGLTIFTKPFYTADIYNWLDRIEQNIDPDRKLSDLF